MEEFKLYPNSLYKVSPDGRVIGIRFNKELKPRLNSRGYFIVGLYHNGTMVNKYIHRLVAEVFIPNPENYPCINHIDGNKLNNNVSNLEFCTHARNTQHAFETGLRKCLPRILSDYDSSEIIEANLSGISKSAIEKHYNVSRSTIYRIIKRYKDEVPL